MLVPLFNKVASLSTCNFLRKRLQHRCFSSEICETRTKKNYLWTSASISSLVILFTMYEKDTANEAYVWWSFFAKTVNGLYPPRKYMLAEYSWNVTLIYSRNIGKKVPMKFRRIFPNNVPRIMNIEYSLNIPWISYECYMHSLRRIKKNNSSFL